MDGQEGAVSWYNLPFYRSLTEEILFMGAPRNVIILNGIVSFMFVFPFCLYTAFICGGTRLVCLSSQGRCAVL